ncbi:hypothetical protein [Streptomyces erythrochromogenes]|uniref:hypothetical protein n=1 Tax=Streptomyces erythrochromogenes TaxID=285574 RepID=UPI0036B08EBE
MDARRLFQQVLGLVRVRALGRPPFEIADVVVEVRALASAYSPHQRARKAGAAPMS